MKALKALGEYTHTHTHITFTKLLKEQESISVLANNAKAYLSYLNFNSHRINNRDGETI